MQKMRKRIDPDTPGENTVQIRSPLYIKNILLAHRKSVQQGVQLSVRRKNKMLDKKLQDIHILGTNEDSLVRDDPMFRHEFKCYM